MHSADGATIHRLHTVTVKHGPICCYVRPAAELAVVSVGRCLWVFRDRKVSACHCTVYWFSLLFICILCIYSDICSVRSFLLSHLLQNCIYSHSATEVFWHSGALQIGLLLLLSSWRGTFLYLNMLMCLVCDERKCFIHTANCFIFDAPCVFGWQSCSFQMILIIYE